jgi:poly(3-hydroxybutyrate) depolymerase
MLSAMAAMKGGRSGMPGVKRVASGAAASENRASHPVPVIVFHGDRDHTVQSSNSAHIVQQVRHAYAAQALEAELSVDEQTELFSGGQRHSRTVHRDAKGQIWIESWTLHGQGHAWSGGNASGSYTNSGGPDASAEMVRFFLSQPTIPRRGL